MSTHFLSNWRKYLNAAIACLVAITLAVLLGSCLTGCSSSSSGSSSSSTSSASTSSSSKSSSKSETVNGYPVSEYNHDVSELETILWDAKSIYHAIENMGDPDDFTTQKQINKYNSLVDSYNDAADEYNAKAKEFSKKYGMTIDGSGGVPTDPDNIDLPSRK